jgi:hypothetical protein
LDGGLPFPNGPTKSFLGEGLYSFSSKGDATKYKSMLEKTKIFKDLRHII